MATANKISTKQEKINQANKTMLIVIGVASFIVIFALVAAKAFISEYSYQSKVISAKKVAVNQLKTDVSSVSSLVDSYKAFVGTPQNVLGKPTNNNGVSYDNGVVILDALPSNYDFPGLISSLDNYLSSQPVTINSIAGTDEQLTEQTQQPSMHPSPVQIPITINATGSYTAIQNLISLLQLSIRPFQVQSIELSGSDNNLTAIIAMVTYYQPSVNFQIGTETIQ